MLRTSALHCFLIVFALFANVLLSQGLSSENDGAGHSSKTQTIEVTPNKSLPITSVPTSPITDLPKEHLTDKQNVIDEAKHAVIAPGDSSKPGQTIKDSSVNSTNSSTTENAVTEKTTSANSADNTDNLSSDAATATTVSIVTSTVKSNSTVAIETTASTTTTTISTTLTNPTADTTSSATETTKIVETTTTQVGSNTNTTDLPVQSSIAAQKPDEGISSGIIALAMAISFAVVVIIVYAGLLLWRRYLEYRYGNRELLVNDLEFDTNDLRHFEL